MVCMEQSLLDYVAKQRNVELESAELETRVLVLWEVSGGVYIDKAFRLHEVKSPAQRPRSTF
jgi:hypothetical protein